MECVGHRTIEQLTDQISSLAHAELSSAVRYSESIGQSGPAINEHNLAWAMAWMLSHAGTTSQVSKAFGIAIESDHGIEALVKRYSQTREGVGGATTLWKQLMISVACEQRIEWHSPEVQASQADLLQSAKLSFDALCHVHRPIILGSCRKLATLDPEEIMMDAWAGMFRSYWSPQASVRWSGLSRVSSLCITAARRNSWKRHGRVHEELDTQGVIARQEVSQSERAGILIAYQECRDQLPGQQRLCAELYLQRDVPQRAIAELLGCGKGNVSNLLKNALRSLRSCLESKGFQEIVEVHDGF